MFKKKKWLKPPSGLEELKKEVTINYAEKHQKVIIKGGFKYERKDLLNVATLVDFKVIGMEKNRTLYRHETGRFLILYDHICEDFHKGGWVTATTEEARELCEDDEASLHVSYDEIFKDAPPTLEERVKALEEWRRTAEVYTDEQSPST